MIAANWPAPKNVKAFTTTREGGVSKPPFSSNNLGDHVGDFPTCVKTNRELLAQQLPHSPIWLNQTHSTNVHRIETSSTDHTILNTDASFTQLKKAVCCVMTADCLPIVVTNKQGNAVAAIHAGWRGLADGIIEETIKEFQDKPEDLLVWFGPAIGPKAFEVGKDVYNQFVTQDASYAVAFIPSGDKYLANIYQLATIRLNNLGITNIYGGEYCSYSQESLFFSYRRDGQTGRMATVIWME